MKRKGTTESKAAEGEVAKMLPKINQGTSWKVCSPNIGREVQTRREEESQRACVLQNKN